MTSDNWVKVAAAADIPLNSMTSVTVNDQEILICHLETGQFCATDNICTHEFARLSEGILDGDLVECPLHAGQFELPSGKGFCEPIEKDLRTYPIKVEDGNLVVNLGG